MQKFVSILFLFLFGQLQLVAQTMPIELLKKDTFNILSPLLHGYQFTPNSDTVLYIPAPKIKTVDSALLARYSYHWILYYDFYTTLTGFHSINSLNPTDVNNIYFYYNIDIKSKFTFRKFTWDFYLFNDYGLRHFFDSLSIKTQDQFTVKNSFYYPIYTSKLNISLTANTQTKLFNTHQYRASLSGEQERYLYDGFMSPGVIVYTGGLTYSAPGNATIALGLGSSKVTKIRNQSLFDTRQESEISGLEKGQKKKVELGISLSSTVPMQKLNRHFYWEFFGNVFAPIKNVRAIRYYTIDVNNVFHFIVLKYVRLSWRTKFAFNYDVNPKPVIQNQISLGFYLSNHL